MLRLALTISFAMFSLGAFAAGPSTPLEPRVPEFALTQILSQSRVLNCVNPGGSCAGTIPCCGQDAYCIRQRCQIVPEHATK